MVAVHVGPNPGTASRKCSAAHLQISFHIFCWVMNKNHFEEDAEDLELRTLQPVVRKCSNTSPYRIPQSVCSDLRRIRSKLLYIPSYPAFTSHSYGSAVSNCQSFVFLQGHIMGSARDL